MIERRRRQANSITAALAPAPERFALFGEPQLLEGEDAASYNEILAQIRAAVKPVDVIDDMFINDVAALEWQVLRWRRLKTGLMRAHILKKLEHFLCDNLDYEQYSEYVANYLSEILKTNRPEDRKDVVERLSRRCAAQEPDAIKRVKEILKGTETDFDVLLEDAQAEKAKDLVQEYARHEPDSVRLINELLTRAGTSTNDLLVEALTEKGNAVALGPLDFVQRIDELTTVAEHRRNACLREIDRRRGVLGETLRRTVREIEEGEFRLIETKPTEGKKVA